MPGLFVVNLRGLINTRTVVRDTLRRLNIETRFRATVVPDTPSYRGMLEMAKEHVAWCEANSELLTKLLEKRGRAEVRTTINQDVLKVLGYKNLGDLAKALSNGEITMNSLGVKPSFTLNSPKGGFKRSIRRMYSQGGILGHNPELHKIVQAMI